jgi:glycosyltransferase 2 family protein
MSDKIRKNILWSIAIGGAIYLALTIYADFDKVLMVFSKFNWLLFPVLLSCSFMNYIMRFAKWHYYLGILKIKVSIRDSFSIFMSGLVMSVTPGKMGELLKSYLLKQVNGEPVSKTIPIVFAERITDFISLVILAIVGAYSFNYGKAIVISVGIFFLATVVLISQKSFVHKLLELSKKVPFLDKNLDKLYNAYESAYIMLTFGPLMKMVIISLFSWFFECLGYYIILYNFGIHIEPLRSSFFYAFGTIVGAISMLPGGLGVTEGSLTFLVQQLGYAKDIAIASTFLIRIVTLWFAVFVGIVSVTLFQRRYGVIITESND